MNVVLYKFRNRNSIMILLLIIIKKKLSDAKYLYILRKDAKEKLLNCKKSINIWKMYLYTFKSRCFLQTRS